MLLTGAQGQYFTVTQAHHSFIKYSDLVVLRLLEVEYRRVVDAHVG